MMTLLQLQQRLRASGRYKGNLDGLWGNQTRLAIIASLTDGPDTSLFPSDYLAAATMLGTQPKNIQAITVVESSGEGFSEGAPVILFEPHRFSKATHGKYDATHPTISYPVWGTKPYPKLQSDRYAQLTEAVSLDVDAGFASASYGRFQILGENFAACNYPASFDFAEAMAYDERSQLLAFVNFVKANRLDAALRSQNWAAFAKGYNGTAYALNHYDVKLQAAYSALSA